VTSSCYAYASIIARRRQRMRTAGEAVLYLRHLLAVLHIMSTSIQNPPRPTWAEIDLAASEYNIRRIRSLLAPNVRVLAMVKAEAYGHGMAGIARAAKRAGVSMLGFASLSEALSLNNATHPSTSLRSAQDAATPAARPSNPARRAGAG